MNIDNDELLRFADMPDGFNADQMDGFRQAAILANKRFDRTVAERVLAIIGEDDEEPYDEGSRFWQKIRNRNELRAELRAAVQTQELRSVTKRRRNDLQTPPHI